MTKTRSQVFAALVALVVLGIAGSASAGIIVTVGKPLPEEQARRVKQGTVAVYPPQNTSSETERAGACYVDKAGTTICTQKIDPITGVPLDWNCVPIGNGQLYCEGPGIGSGPGEGGEGYLDPSYDVGEMDDDGVDDTEIEAMGCAGGMGLSGGIMGVVSLVAIVVLMLRGRRR